MESYVNPVTGEREPFFVQTNERVEHFATYVAAHCFIAIHCRPTHSGGTGERVIRSNAY